VRQSNFGFHSPLDWSDRGGALCASFAPIFAVLASGGNGAAGCVGLLVGNWDFGACLWSRIDCPLARWRSRKPGIGYIAHLAGGDDDLGCHYSWATARNMAGGWLVGGGDGTLSCDPRTVGEIEKEVKILLVGLCVSTVFGRSVFYGQAPSTQVRWKPTP
jgi:hypothetical protein